MAKKNLLKLGQQNTKAIAIMRSAKKIVLQNFAKFIGNTFAEASL